VLDWPPGWRASRWVDGWIHDVLARHPTHVHQQHSSLSHLLPLLHDSRHRCTLLLCGLNSAAVSSVQEDINLAEERPGVYHFPLVNYQSEMAFKPLTFFLLSCLIVAALGQGKEGASGERRSAPGALPDEDWRRPAGAAGSRLTPKPPASVLTERAVSGLSRRPARPSVPFASACACYHSIFATNTDQFPLQEGFADSCGCYYPWLRPGTSTPFTVSVWTYCS
jgi:hypothetical protein